MANIKHKVYTFKKIDYNGTGRRINLVELSVRLSEQINGRIYFSACGGVWNSKKTDYLAGGQMIDDLSNEFHIFKHNKKYVEIQDLWEKYHLKYLDEIPEDDVKRIEKLFE